MSDSNGALPQKSEPALGPGQNRSAIASGEALTHSGDPTLPRYGTDLVQQ